MILYKLRLFGAFFLSPIVSFMSLRNKLFPELASRSDESLDVVRELEAYNFCLVHVSLGAIRRGSISIDELLELLSRAERTVLVPAFTPSVRRGGRIFDKSMPPEVGKFSTACLQRGFPRTLDPLHSFFLVGGKEGSFDDYVGTFSEGSPLRECIMPGSCWINVGTLELVSTVLHLIESDCALPYIRAESVDALADGSARISTFRSFRYRAYVNWNRARIEEKLLESGALKRGYYRGVFFRLIDGEVAYRVICKELSGDRYWLFRKTSRRTR